MLKYTVILAALWITAVPGGAAQAAGYTSDTLGFSADFPTSPDIGAPEGSEKDAQGNFISTLVSAISKKQGEYLAAVFTDTFVVASKIDVEGSLKRERDTFVDGMSASVTASHDSMVSGNRASYFNYDTQDHRAQGEGLVIVVEAAEKPRIYLVITMHTPRASADEVAATDKFFSSFRLR